MLQKQPSIFKDPPFDRVIFIHLRYNPFLMSTRNDNYSLTVANYVLFNLIPATDLAQRLQR